MNITVRYFAALREALGAQETVQLSGLPAATTLGALRDHLIASSPRHAEALRRGRALRCALNQSLAGEDAVLEDGAEVAFFPPVTGG
jgi:molybdopterin synthase sulfur carrier subunit